MIIEGSPQALEIGLSTNLYKEETDKTIITAGVDLQNIWIEYSNDLVWNLAELGLAFTNTSKLSNYTIPKSQEHIQKTIELYTPLHIIKEAYSLEILSEEKMALLPWKVLLKGHKMTEEQKKKEAMLKQKQSIAKLD